MDTSGAVVIILILLFCCCCLIKLFLSQPSILVLSSVFGAGEGWSSYYGVDC